VNSVGGDCPRFDESHPVRLAYELVQGHGQKDYQLHWGVRGQVIGGGQLLIEGNGDDLEGLHVFLCVWFM